MMMPAALRSAGLGADIDLRSPAPECLQIVNACHLVGAKVRALKANLSEIFANKSGQLQSAPSNQLFRGPGGRIKKENVDIFSGIVPFPNTNHAAIVDD